MIPKNLTYLFVDGVSLLFPFLFSFTKKYDFKNYWKYFFPANIIVSVIYIVWDSFYTHLGVWGFHHEYTLGFKILNLPLEELAFFICIPYACLFTYYCFRKYIFFKLQFDGKILWLVGSAIFLGLSVNFHDKLYTGSAFFSCSISFFIAYFQNTTRFYHFILFYVVILIPFLIFNGILTGSFLNRVVVYYNDMENIGRRILSIPFEDVFYGMAMLHFNILGFEFLIKKRTSA